MVYVLEAICCEGSRSRKESGTAFSINFADGWKEGAVQRVVHGIDAHVEQLGPDDRLVRAMRGPSNKNVNCTAR